MIITILIIIPVFILGGLMLNITVSYINEEVSNSNMELLDKNLSSVETELSKIQDMFFLLASNNEIHTIMSMNTVNSLDYSNLEKLKEIFSTFAMAETLNKNISDVFIYFRGSDTVLDSKGFFTKRLDYRYAELINVYINLDEKSFKWVNSYRYDDSKETKDYIVVSHRFFSVSPKNSVLIFATIDERNINSMLNTGSGGEDNLNMILDAGGRIISHIDKELIQKEFNPDILRQFNESMGRYVHTQEASHRVWLYRVSGLTGWKYVSSISMDSFYGEIFHYQKLFILISIAVVFTAVVLSLFITGKLSEPINMILSILKNHDEWIPENETDKIRFGELKLIGTNLISSLKEKEKLKSTLEERLKMMKKAQFTALQSQINPHFLYNTLEAINWSIRDKLGLENEPSDLLNSLSDFLRFSLEEGDNLISIGYEIANLKNYIDIQLFRYGNRFRVDWDIPEELRHYKMIKITLQPLVENAILHGIKHLKQGGVIGISARIELQQIIISVSDNGKGMSFQSLQALKQALNETELEAGESIGLKNVNFRHRILFGEQWGIQLESSPEAGTKVSVCFPAIPGEINAP